MPRIQDSGERLIPDLHHDGVVYAEHMVRYLFACRFLAGKRVLDVASGVGYGSDMLKAAGAAQVIGVDRSRDAVVYGATHHASSQPDYLVGDAEWLPLRDGQLDVVVSFETIEHVPDYHRFLAEVKRILRPDGLFLVSTPNKGIYLDDNPFHTKEFTFDEFEGTLSSLFRNVRTLAQDDWITSAILTPSTLEKADRAIAGGIKGHKAIGKPATETLYMVSLCSDAPLPRAGQYAVLTSLYEVRSYLDQIARLDTDIASLVSDVTEREAALADKDRHIANIEAALTGKDGLLTEKDGLLAEKDALLAEKGALLTEKDTSLAEKDTLLTEKDASLAAKDAQLRDLQVHYQLAIGSLGYRLLERARRVINWLAPLGTRRRGVLKLPRKGLRIVRREGWGAFLRRAVRVWRWAPRLLASARPAEVELPLDHQYQFWLQAHAFTPARTTAILRKATRLSYRPLVSVIVPVYNPDPQWLRDAIESVRAQLYDNWELCIADDASSDPGVRAVLEDYARADERIKVVYLKENEGISAASNRALALAAGEFVGLLDHDDELKPDALYEVVKLLNEQPDLDFIYTDEDKRRPDGRLGRPFFKPDWSPDLLLSVNYVPHLAVYRKRMVDEVGGLRSECDLSQDYDLALRVAERTEHIWHIPLPLYTWRMAAGSASATHEDKLRAMKSAKRALAEAIQRRGIEADILDGSVVTTYRVRYRIQGQPLVSIIIPTRDRIDLLSRCIASIEMKSTYRNYEIVIVDNDSKEKVTFEYLNKLPHRCVAYPGPFNYAAMTNFAVGEAAGEYVLFLNNDTEVITGEWIEAMLEHGQRPEVAAVGTRLLYPDGRPQHEGIIIGLGGSSAGNVNHGGYFGLDELVHNVSAVTGACMMTRRDVFDRLGGFEENLGVAFNDVDYCLRAREQGYLIVYTPYALLYHHESGTRGKLHPMEDELFFRKRWGEPGQYRDPYYNPNLSLKAPFTIKVD